MNILYLQSLGSIQIFERHEEDNDCPRLHFRCTFVISGIVLHVL